MNASTLLNYLQDSRHCEYLHYVYEKQLESIVRNEYSLNFPSTILSFISRITHDNDELQIIFKSKLFNKHYMDLYGFKSHYFKQTQITNILSNYMIIAHQTYISLNYLTNINNISFSFLLSLLWFTFNIIIKSNTITQYKRYIQIHGQAEHNSNMISVERTKLKNILLYYKAYSWRKVHVSTFSLFINTHHFILYLLPFILPKCIQSHYSYRYANFMANNLVYFSEYCTVSLIQTLIYRSMIDPLSKPLSNGNNLFPPENILTLLLWDRSSCDNTGVWLQQLGLCAYSLFNLINYFIKTQNKVKTTTKLYFVSRILCGYSLLAPNIDCSITSWKYKYMSLLFSVIGHNIAYFWNIGYWIKPNQKSEVQLCDYSNPYDIGQWDWMDN